MGNIIQSASTALSSMSLLIMRLRKKARRSLSALRELLRRQWAPSSAILALPMLNLSLTGMEDMSPCMTSSVPENLRHSHELLTCQGRARARRSMPDSTASAEEETRVPSAHNKLIMHDKTQKGYTANLVCAISHLLIICMHHIQTFFIKHMRLHYGYYNIS